MNNTLSVYADHSRTKSIDMSPASGYTEQHTDFAANDETSTSPEPKTLHNSDISGARENVRDIEVVGNGDLFTLLSKASSQNEGWMKSTKAMQTKHGCVVQVTTQQLNVDLTYSVAEALTYVPGVKIRKLDTGGAELVPH